MKPGRELGRTLKLVQCPKRTEVGRLDDIFRIFLVAHVAFRHHQHSTPEGPDQSFERVIIPSLQQADPRGFVQPVSL